MQWLGAGGKLQIANYQFPIAKGKELVETAEARLEAAKLSADWCKWMVALQTGSAPAFGPR